jgi:hypothetical protein
MEFVSVGGSDVAGRSCSQFVLLSQGGLPVAVLRRRTMSGQ